MPWRARLPHPRALRRALAAGLRRSLPALIGLAGIAVVAGAAWLGYRWLTSSDRFAIEQIDVRGNERLADDRVRTLSGIAVGDNVFRVDPAAVERSLTANPWIASAEVARELPDRVVVTVVERQPAALVDLGGLYLADGDGHVFKRAATEANEGAALPVITGLDRDDYVADQATVQAAIRRALRVGAIYAADARRPRLGEIHVDPRRGITLLTYDTALAVHLGRSSDAQLTERLAAFDAAWNALDDDERLVASVVYVNNETNPDRITVRLGGKN